MPAVERSPTSNKKPDQETMDTQTGLVNETASYPSGKLSAVTRKANEIKEVLNTELPDRNWVKTHLSIYKERVSNFTSACMSLENQECFANDTAFQGWFKNHQDTMDLFVHEVKNWIRQSRCNNSEASSVTNKTHSSSSTRVSSITSKLAKERAKLEAIEAVRIQEEILECKKAEERARRKEQEAQAQMSAEKLEQESRNLAAAKQRIFVQALEKQAKKLQMINDDEQNNLAIQLKELDESGLVQNPYFDSIFARSNQEANKLKEELNLNPMAASFKMNVPALPIQDQGLPNELTRDNQEKNLSALQMNQSLSNEDMVTVLMRSQQRAFLPKCEPNCFDGLDSTQFHEFIYSFKSMIADKCDSDIDRFAYLSRYTSGLALQIVKSCRTLKNPSANYRAALTGLENEFGNEFKISNSYLERLNNWPQVKNEDGLALQQFSIFLADIKNQMLHFSSLNQLNSPAEIRRIINKLPYKLRDRWRSFVCDSIDRGKNANFSDLVLFVAKQSHVLNLPLYTNIADPKKEQTLNSGTKDGSNIKKRVFSTLLNKDSKEGGSYESRKLSCLFCGKDGHTLAKCFAFVKESLDDRLKFVAEKKLCFRCLGEFHRSAGCRSKVKCDNCSGRHHTLVHKDRKLEIRDDNTKLCEAKLDDGQEEGASHLSTAKKALVSNHGGDSQKRVVCAAVPVKIRIMGTEGFCTTYMGLDNHCNGVFMSEKLISKLGARPVQQIIPLTAMHHAGKLTRTGVLNNLEVLDLDENERAVFPVVFCQRSWPFSVEDAPNPRDLDGYPEFLHLPFRYLEEGSEIGLLVGNNHPNVIKPLQIFDGICEMDPYVTVHKFGIALNGPVCSVNRNSLKCNRVNINKSSNENKMFETLCAQEFKEEETSLGPSVEDIKWEQLVKNSMKKLDTGHYEVDLPFRSQSISLPSNRNQVLQRLYSLRRRMLKDGDLFDEYASFVNEMLDEGFAEPVPTIDLPKTSAVWYLVHFGVRHKQKHKLRVVFDASLKFKGTSLNDLLLQGPDLSSTLLGVLLRFRQQRTAFMGDIKKMFFQVKVSPGHQDYLRFFWYPDSNLDAEPIEYRLTVHLFGAISSPSISNYVLKNTVNSVESDGFSPPVLQTVLRNFYVDDLLKSVDGEEEAVELLKDVCQLVSEAGFQLTGFTSNSRFVLDSVSKNDLSKGMKSLNISTDSLPQERALGVLWGTESDVIKYNLKLPAAESTKRGVLRTVFSVYDPLGLVSPAILPAKVLFQRACSANMSWDCDLPPDLRKDWEEWTTNITRLSELEIPRCYMLGERFANVEMHVFCDGSQLSYAAVGYLRFVRPDGRSNCCIAMSRNRLVPHKRKPTIPRIELSGAKLAVMIGQILLQELEYDIARVYYWTDSTTVLKYLRNENRRFHRFVSNRVTYIRNHTDIGQWKHVPGTLNPADLACRGTSKIEDLQSEVWRCGPDFLKKSEVSWPVEHIDLANSDLEPDDPELCRDKKILRTDCSTATPTERLLESSSDWFKLKVRVSWMRRFFRWIINKQSTLGPLTTEEMDGSLRSIWSYVQQQEFPDVIEEFRRLKTSSDSKRLCHILKKENLSKLHPFYDGQLLRVGGRISRADVPEETKHPIILPSSHSAVRVFVRDVHFKMGHLGKERILADVRCRYWIIGANNLARFIVRNCISCIKQQGRPAVQIMADLPRDRLTADCPAFTNIGLDAFGPFLVTRGRCRGREKRWGLIFTCLVSRAVHLEMIYTLDLNSFLDALRRFISRRGVPRIVRCDNGTNFVGANRELRESILSWNSSCTREWMLQKNIDWRFQPPAASHFGGVWEREIRTVRKVMNGLLNEQPLKMDDEGLYTLFCEVEAILNGRPLTAMSDDPSDMNALTPNHLLLVRPGPAFPPGIFTSDDCYTRRRWRQIQYLADLFWKRWKVEYLPLLQSRLKWEQPKKSLEVGDLVLLVDNLSPRNHWNMGRVIKTNPDDKGHVRFADLKVPNSATEVRRPISKLIPLNLKFESA